MSPLPVLALLSSCTASSAPPSASSRLRQHLSPCVMSVSLSRSLRYCGCLSPSAAGSTCESSVAMLSSTTSAGLPSATSSTFACNPDSACMPPPRSHCQLMPSAVVMCSHPSRISPSSVATASRQCCARSSSPVSISRTPMPASIASMRCASVSGSNSAVTYTTGTRSSSGSTSTASRARCPNSCASRRPAATLSAMLRVSAVLPAPVGPVSTVTPRMPYSACSSAG